MNTQLNKACEELILKTEYYEEILHDIKTPFSTAHTLLLLLEKCEEIDINFRTYLSMMKINIECINKILLSSNKSSQLLSSAIIPKYKVYNIIELAKETTFSMTTIGVRKNIKVTFISDFDEIYSCMDKELFERILLNLISNAIKYSPENTDVEVSICLLDAQNYLVEVCDEGYGISEELKNTIYRRCERGDNSFNQYGTGLGLYIVKYILDSLKGTIEIVKNKTNIGTLVRIKLPIITVINDALETNTISLLDCQPLN